MMLFWGYKVKGEGHKVNKSILHTRTAIHGHSLGGVTSRWRGIELCECLILVVVVVVERCC